MTSKDQHDETAIKNNYTPMQYYRKMLQEGHDATYAAQLTNAVFQEEE